MNEHELDQALRAIGMRHVRETAPSSLHELVMVVPPSTPERRRWLLSPAWGLQSLFSTTKFVVATAIVALFGGFLLAGVLTQPVDERLPPAAASASSSPEADEISSTVRTDILPGVVLTVEEVEPGVLRVLSDGLHDLGGRVRALAVGTGGELWVALDTTDYWNLVRLGEAESIRAPGRKQRKGDRDFGALSVTTDGLPVVARGDITWVLEEDLWAETDPSPYDECVMAESLAAPGVSDTAVAADESCWARGDGGTGLVRVDPDDTTTRVTGGEIGLEPDEGVGHLAAGPDGTVWATVTRPGQRFAGLLAYEGSEWSVVPYTGEGVLVYDAVAVDVDGAVWVSRLSPARGSIPSRILRWDGETWTENPFVTSQGAREPTRIRAWPNGVIWFGAVATRWDGANLVEIEPADWWAGRGGGATATAPNGVEWVVPGASGDLYAVTPPALTATE